MGNVFGSRQKVIDCEAPSVDCEDKIVEIDESGEAIKEPLKDSAEAPLPEPKSNELNEAEMAAATAICDMKEDEKTVHFDEKQLHKTPNRINRRLTGFPLKPLESEEPEMEINDVSFRQDEPKPEPKNENSLPKTTVDPKVELPANSDTVQETEAVTPKKARRRRGKRRLGSKSNFQLLMPDTPVSFDTLQSYSDDQLRDKLAVRGLDIEGVKFDLVKRLHIAVARKRGLQVAENFDNRKRKLSYSVDDTHTSKRRSILGELDLRTMR